MKRRVLKKKANIFLRRIRNPANEFGFLVCPLKAKRYPSILPANIYIDDGGLWLNLGTKKIVLFQTNRNNERDWDNIIAMTIEAKPIMLGKPNKMDLSPSEIEKVKAFVKRNQKVFMEIASGKIEHEEFFRNTGLIKEEKQ